MAGGVFEQDLTMLVQILAIDLVFKTWRNHNNKDYDWSNFSPTQRDIIKQVEQWQT